MSGPLRPAPAATHDAEEARKFADLQARAALAGHQLYAVRSGYMLLRGSSSVHSACLRTLAIHLARREVAA